MGMIRKIIFLIKKTAFVIYEIFVNRENDANKERESSRKNVKNYKS